MNKVIKLFLHWQHLVINAKARFSAIFLQWEYELLLHQHRNYNFASRGYTLKIEFHIPSTLFRVTYSPSIFCFLPLLFYFSSCESIIVRCREVRAWSKLVFPSRISQDILPRCALCVLTHLIVLKMQFWAVLIAFSVFSF